MKVKFFIILIGACLSSVALAGPPPSNIPVLSGVVQHISRDKIQVNDLEYIVVKKVPAYQLVMRKGAYQQQKIDFDSIHNGDAITYKAIGNVIIEVRIEGR